MVLCKMKDETRHVIIVEFVVLISKLYRMKKGNDAEDENLLAINKIFFKNISWEKTIKRKEKKWGRNLSIHLHRQFWKYYKENGT